MTSVDLASSYVALGELRRVPCSECGGERAEQAVTALTDAGVIQLGLMIGEGGMSPCRCGVLWLCSLCPERIPMDGASPWRHTRKEHSRITV